MPSNSCGIVDTATVVVAVVVIAAGDTAASVAIVATEDIVAEVLIDVCIQLLLKACSTYCYSKKIVISKSFDEMEGGGSLQAPPPSPLT